MVGLAGVDRPQPPAPAVSFDAFTVSTASGPHVTLQAGTRHAGRYWTTTTRRSVKVGAVRRTEQAAVSHADGARTTIVRGRGIVLDPSRPASVLGAPFETVLVPGVLARIAASQIDQVVGYAEAGRGIPPEFLPWGRVLLVASVDHELVMSDGRVISARGDWVACAPVGVGGGADPGRPVLPAAVPRAVAALAGEDRTCWLGVGTAGGPVAVPGTWSAARGTVSVSTEVLAAVGASLPAAVCCTLDDSSSRRPDRKLGCMLRGDGALVESIGPISSVAVTPRRISWWDGFEAGSAPVERV